MLQVRRWASSQSRPCSPDARSRLRCSTLAPGTLYLIFTALPFVRSLGEQQHSTPHRLPPHAGGPFYPCIAFLPLFHVLLPSPSCSVFVILIINRTWYRIVIESWHFLPIHHRSPSSSCLPRISSPAHHITYLSTAYIVFSPPQAPHPTLCSSPSPRTAPPPATCPSTRTAHLLHTHTDIIASRTLYLDLRVQSSASHIRTRTVIVFLARLVDWNWNRICIRRRPWWSSYSSMQYMRFLYVFYLVSRVEKILLIWSRCRVRRNDMKVVRSL